MVDLKEMAEKIAPIYAENPKVDAVLLGGSVSRGWQDQFSDIELLIFWNRDPSEGDRKKPIGKLKGAILDFHPYEEEEWSETYLTEGIKLEISSFLTTTMQRYINRTIQELAVDPDTQCIAAAIQYGEALSGKMVIKEMKQQLENYPDDLRKAMIVENLDFGSRWQNREALLFRKDWLMLYRVFADVETKIMSILFGLNRQYLIHPGFKWQRQTLEGMPIKPENMAARMEAVFLGKPQEAVKELEMIIREVFELIARELPALELENAKKQTERVRPRHEGKQ